ncbi:hypothetical protein [Sporosarcina cyprini]|uniref:hypothetical protein n=1 Tax=Sporosarcina cyprini TaxID=2910523 RepID=UPI001EDF6491|nr:hypothetical protein [Sporosarcina cyprini]MCG3088092.1 hypothetical protein [Sporosarcina cyprini]
MDRGDMLLVEYMSSRGRHSSSRWDIRAVAGGIRALTEIYEWFAMTYEWFAATFDLFPNYTSGSR